MLTRDASYQAAGAVVVTSFERAHDVAYGDALRRFATEIMVIGGGEIYAQWMSRADRLEITEVHTEVAGDAVFKPDLAGWEEVARIRNKAGPDDSCGLLLRDFAEKAAELSEFGRRALTKPCLDPTSLPYSPAL